MKIGFVTNYDLSTKSNFNIVSECLPNDSFNMMSMDATRKNLIDNLSRRPQDDVFIFTHGSDNCFYDNDDKIAYSDKDAYLNKRIVFVYACYTANLLGKVTANSGSIYWGYTGRLAALEDADESKHIFINIVSDILDNFTLLKNKKEIIKYLDKLKLKCESGQYELDKIAENNPDFDVMEGYKALMHIWSRLRIYYKSENTKLFHSEAEVNDLFE